MSIVVGLPVDVLAVGVTLWAAAFSASFIGSMVGAGAGLITIPITHMIFMQLGLDSTTAMVLTVGTCGLSMLLAGPRAISTYNKYNAIDWAIVRHASLPILAGTGITHVMGFANDGDLLKIVFACMATLVGLYMLVGQQRWRIADKVPLGPSLWAFGLGLGILCPLVGMTGTIFAIPMMVACGMTLRRSIGTACVLTVLIGVPATLMYATAPGIDFPLTLGVVSIPAALIIAAAGYFGAPLGVMVQQKVPANALRIAFSAMLFLSAGRFLWMSFA